MHMILGSRSVSMRGLSLVGMLFTIFVRFMTTPSPVGILTDAMVVSLLRSIHVSKMQLVRCCDGHFGRPFGLFRNA